MSEEKQVNEEKLEGQQDDTQVGNSKESPVTEETQAGSAEDSEHVLQHDSVESLQEQLEAALAKADENWDQALRAKAEMENLRRRTDKDIDNARKFGIEKIANELLPVKDSMELGIKAAKEMESSDAESIEKITEGMHMTMQQFDTAMEKVGIEDVAAEEGDIFNPEVHQAMSMLEMEGKKSNTIVSVFQKGYTLKGRLLRPAMVVVAK